MEPVEKEEPFKMIKMAVREALEEEFLERFLNNVPDVSDEEMRDIIQIYGAPSREKKPVYSETIVI
ncbi:hypothetical protein [Thermodesulfovibrio yellowstonii]|uniref:Uncharacterized protein n=1 Tax=Thermodesulfovibrio yellowstonii TaxID=28262 RepID=A0A9W6GE75_9BACT|nr:hypothetical protein [Thermodesulfovibrio islandicus]GLI52365.1 hypothetical protein TISLANDTSLP1_00580 [Thermodesulfovibrio islandicus]